MADLGEVDLLWGLTTCDLPRPRHRRAGPDVGSLDGAARQALEALLPHDAQKEHASVPAFARLSWLLAAGGAPADIVEAVHRAALEEIDHAQRCFARPVNCRSWR